jgi:spermidine synthase
MVDRLDGEVGSAAEAHPSRPRLGAGGRWLLFAYAISGAAALVYEVAWMRQLGETFGSTAYASGTMLSAFMTGLGIGALIGGRIAKRTRFPLKAASRAELGIAASSVVALLALRYLPGMFFDLLKSSGVSPAVFLGLQFGMSFLVMVLPTLAMGMTFPLIIEGVGKRSRIGRWSGMLYTANTGGAIVGSLAAGFLLIPTIGLSGALAVAAGLSIITAAIVSDLSVRSEGGRSFWRSPESYVAAIAIVAVLAVPPPPPQPLGVTMLDRFESSSEYEEAMKSTKVIFQEDSIYSTVSVLENPNGDRSMRNGAMIEGSSMEGDVMTVAVTAALPTASVTTSETALVIGLGTGYTSTALIELGWPSITTVEINPAVVGAAEYFAGPNLRGSPGWSLVVDDGRGYLLTNPARYDAITSEPSWPINAGVAPLYTLEMMQAARSRLTTQGVFCQWLPNYLLGEDDVKMMYKTLRQVYPRVDAWEINPRGTLAIDLMFVGFMDKDSVPVEEVARRLDANCVALGVPTGVVIPFRNPASLEAAVTDPSVPLNTDDHSRLEYAVVWNLLRNATGGATP